ncbi:MAG: nucleotidyltransferase family protein, partial [Acidimicrobiales bacterium]
PLPTQGRVMVDLDLLVEEEEIDTSCRALTDAGYEIRPGQGVAAGFQWSAWRPDRACPIDLHRALGGEVVARALPVHELLERTSVREVDGLSYRVLEPADQLSHAIVHSELNDMAHRTGSIALRQLHNFAQLYRRIGGGGAWTTAVARLDRRETRKAVAGHAALQRYLFGLDLPLPRPTFAARMHLARCLLTYAIPHLSDLETNLLLAFDPATLDAAYPGSSRQAARLRHLVRSFRGGVESVLDSALTARNR